MKRSKPVFKQLLRFGLGGIAVVVLVITGILAWSHISVQNRLDRVYVVPLPELDFNHVDLALGERVVKIRNGCVDCHGHDLGGAKVMEDPAFATIHGPNITPAALADWSDVEILRAIRHGVGREGRPLLLMPSHEYQFLSGDDLVSAVAYLRTVPPVERANGPVKLGPVAKILTATGRLPTFLPAEIMDHNSPLVIKPAEAPTRDFGGYLVQSACIGCHGPNLRGGPIPGGPPEWPPASDISAPVIAGWSKDQFFQIMRTGVSSTGEKMRPPMPVELTSQLDDVELEAMWLYLSAGK